MRRLLLTLAGLLLAQSASAVTIDWVTVGDPGNPADTNMMTDGTTGYGSVGYVYRISKYETTNAQYAEFLNAVAAIDTNELYSIEMRRTDLKGGIARSGDAGSYTYTAITGRENMPVNWVSFYDILRFANWLNNGQPTGPQDNVTTEDGAYTITVLGTSNNSITRNAGATIFLTSEDEWYKAAYYDPVSTSYFEYPAGSDTQTVYAAPGATPNTANEAGAVGDLTEVGSYTGSASPIGTFDQGGNVNEWNEAVSFTCCGGIPVSDVRGLRGGGFNSSPFDLAASRRSAGVPTEPNGNFGRGFRVASILEPRIEIDIKPGSDLNPINPFSRGVTPVAILGSDAFDVRDVDVTTLAFGPGGALSALSRENGFLFLLLSHFDLNEDGYRDLISLYPTEETGIAIGDDEACLSGETLDGAVFQGCDHISTVPKGCGLGFELVFLLPPLMWLRRRRGASLAQ